MDMKRREFDECTLLRSCCDFFFFSFFPPLPYCVALSLLVKLFGSSVCSPTQIPDPCTVAVIKTALLRLKTLWFSNSWLSSKALQQVGAWF